MLRRDIADFMLKMLCQKVNPVKSYSKTIDHCLSFYSEPGFHLDFEKAHFHFHYLYHHRKVTSPLVFTSFGDCPSNMAVFGANPLNLASSREIRFPTT